MKRSIHALVSLLVTALCGLCENTANAQSDSHSSPTPNSAGSTHGTTVGATSDGVSDCDTPIGIPDVWYCFTPASDGAVTVYTCGVTDIDPILSIHSACGTPAITCNDMADPFPCGEGFLFDASLTFTATRGDKYWIRVAARRGLTGEFDLVVVPPPPPGPPNNACADATTVTAGVTSFDATGATTDGLAGCTVNQDIWFRYAAPSTGATRFSLCGSSFDTAIAVYHSSACPRTNLAVCNNDSCGRQSEAIVDVIGGTTYSVRVGSAGAATGAGTLTITHCQSYNGCSSRPQVSAGTTYFSTVGATGFEPTARCTVNQDIWFYYYPHSVAQARISLCGSSFDTTLAAYAALSCPPANIVACNDDFCGLQSEVTVAGAGNVIAIRIGSDVGETSLGVLTITPLAPINDLCANATVLAGNPLQVAIGNALANTNGPADCGVFRGIWYRYTPTFSGTALITSDLAPINDGILAVYASSAYPPTNLIACGPSRV